MIFFLLAVQKSCLVMVEKLVNAGACLNVKNYIENTPLHCAATNGDYDCVQLLLNVSSDSRAKQL